MNQFLLIYQIEIFLVIKILKEKNDYIYSK